MDNLEDRLNFLRDSGYSVAIHNDYRQGGKRMTFYLFTHISGTWVRGEAETDSKAIDEVMRRIGIMS